MMIENPIVIYWILISPSDRAHHSSSKCTQGGNNEDDRSTPIKRGEKENGKKMKRNFMKDNLT